MKRFAAAVLLAGLLAGSAAAHGHGLFRRQAPTQSSYYYPSYSYPVTSYYYAPVTGYYNVAPIAAPVVVAIPTPVAAPLVAPPVAVPACPAPEPTYTPP